MEEHFQLLVELLLKKAIPAFVTTGTVKDVDETLFTCTVERDGAPTLYKVRLNGIVGEAESNITVIPTKETIVICSLIENDVTEAIVIACEKPEKVLITLGETKLAIDKEGIIINDGKLGGTVIVKELVDNLAKLTARVDAIFDGFKQLMPDAPQAGSVTLCNGLKAITSPTKEDFGNIEDEKVKH